MINYGKVYSATQPPAVVTIDDNVYIASNIQEYTKIFEEDDEIILEEHGYEYDYVCYTKLEYMDILLAQSNASIQALQEELEATKILLGVE